MRGFGRAKKATTWDFGSLAVAFDKTEGRPEALHENVNSIGEDLDEIIRLRVIESVVIGVALMRWDNGRRIPLG